MLLSFNSRADDQKVILQREANQTLSNAITPNVIETVSTSLADTGTQMVVQTIPSASAIVKPLPDQTPLKMLERLLELPTLTWNVGAAATTALPLITLDPYAELMALPVVQDIFQWYYYFRADIEVHFRLNTNQFYAGALAFTAAPGAHVMFDGPDSSQQCRSWLGMQIISACQQDTVVLTMPWSFPQRFFGINDFNNDHPRFWSLYVDILSPLVASVAAPSSIDVTVFARFKNIRLYFPLQSATMAMQRQSGIGSAAQVKLNTYAPRRKTVRVSVSGKDPVSEAVSPSTPGITSGLSSLMKPISEVGNFVEGVASEMQPVLGLAENFLGLLDKPEIQEPVTRVYQTTAANMAQADRPDQSLPLALYQTSYLNQDPSAMPGGGNWTFAQIAMTPALHGQFRFTTNSGAGSSVVLPFMAPGTPLALCVGTHALWRSSVRLQCRFYCPAFVSARFLFVLSPRGVPTVDAVANNLTRVIDVKGDTVDSFTLPYVFPTDFMGGSDSTSINWPYVIQISVLSQIVTNDTSITPSIDLIVFSAAGPDCQFSVPVYNGFRMTYSYPNNLAPTTKKTEPPKLAPGKQEEKEKEPPSKARSLMRSFKGLKFIEMERQSSVVGDFRKEFPPFLMDCEYLTDSHHVTSETSLYVTDVLKRYMNALPVTMVSSVGNMPATYQPDPYTLGWILARSFLFQRGGVRYKFVENDQKFMSVMYGPTPTAWTGFANGNATLLGASPAAMELDVSVPWMQDVPYQSVLINLEQPTLDVALYYTDDITALSIYTAVRDDFQLGFLVPPDVYN